MVWFALADTSGMARSATSPLLVLLLGGELGGVLGCAGTGVTADDCGGAAEDAGCDRCKRVRAKTITMSASTIPPIIATMRLLDRVGSLNASDRSPTSGGAIWSNSLAGSSRDGGGVSNALTSRSVARFAVSCRKHWRAISAKGWGISAGTTGSLFVHRSHWGGCWVSDSTRVMPSAQRSAAGEYSPDAISGAS